MNPTDPQPIQTAFTRQAGVDYPILCGAMYPCSNPELVAAASAAGAMGVVQPISLTYVHGREFRAGLREIRALTHKPIGFNAIVEKSVQRYEDRLREWVDISLEEGVRFFVTALGNPRWVVDAVHATGGIVYHDVTERRWADKALQEGVDGLICVNRRAGGHAGDRGPEELHAELADLGVPLVLAGGVGNETQFKAALDMGYDGVQMGTRFIATSECVVHADYHAAILEASEEDIVLTDKLSGVPCSVINTPLIERLGASAGPLAAWLLRHPRTKHWMRTFYALRSLRQLKRSSQRGLSYRDVFQAGKSVGSIHEVEPAGDIVRRFVRKAQEPN
jgi:nitronate monooxygenase